MASNASLNNVVNSLVRASMGASVAPTVTDEDLDRHVAELILKEAKAKAEKYATDGIRAYLPHTGLPENNVPKANKRFLNSLVKNVSDHNRVILQAQAESAEQIKEAKRQEEMRDRRRRAEEASGDRIRVQRLVGQGQREPRGSRRDESHPRDRYGQTSSLRHRSRSPRRRDRDSRRSQSPRNRSRSPKRSESPPRRRRLPQDDDRRNDRKRERSPSYRDDRPSKRQPRRDRSPRHSGAEHEDKGSRHCYKNEGKGKERADSDRTDDTPRLSDSTPDTPRKPDSPSRSPSPEDPLPDNNAPSYSSKMDKYFAPTYDPRLDVTQPTVSKSGLLDGPQWDGWEGMLEVMRVRAVDKEEKKRRAKEDKEKSKFDKKRAKKKAGTSIPTAPPASSTPISEVGLMDMQYKKRGVAKEWDLAKEMPT
ncbi:hypothetical protein FRC10_001300 [Ceratobasidium sp. 414]|nr:hypothetical protein FRC10_001300 [Ceratobasidium sp. 414]